MGGMRSGVSCQQSNCFTNPVGGHTVLLKHVADEYAAEVFA